jgi:hypothetical protein
MLFFGAFGFLVLLNECALTASSSSDVTEKKSDVFLRAGALACAALPLRVGRKRHPAVQWPPPQGNQ